MTPQHAGALHWQESRFFRLCAVLAKYESDRRHYERMAQQAEEDRQKAEGQPCTKN
jgi:hypothetical protein